MNANAAPFVPRPQNQLGGRRQWTSLRPEHCAVASRTEKPLKWSDGPLVWIDCEVILPSLPSFLLTVISHHEHSTETLILKMTGLDYKKDPLLEIAVLITNGNLDVVDPNGLNYIIKTDKDILDNMDPWCVKQHGEVSRLLRHCSATPRNAFFLLFVIIFSLV
jgi:hypothetical protein